MRDVGARAPERVHEGERTGDDHEDPRRQREDDHVDGSLREVQRALAFLAYPISAVDGQYGPNSRNAFAEFKDDIGEGNRDIVSDNAIEKLKERTGQLSAVLNTSLANKEQVKDAIADTCKAMELGRTPQIAYVLATA